MIRFYLLPIERSGSSRGPKYFLWNRYPEPSTGINCQWSMKDYGSIDQGVLAANILLTDHNVLVANVDVYAFPENIDAIMPQSEQNTLRSFMEGYGIPSQWLSGQMTYRAVLRTVTGMFLYMQRFLALLGYPQDAFQGLTLNTQFQNLPTTYQAAAQQATTDLGYTWNVNANTTVRVLLKNMADSWGAAPIHFGFVTL